LLLVRIRQVVRVCADTEKWSRAGRQAAKT
jgi:hypothetical protein